MIDTIRIYFNDDVHGVKTFCAKYYGKGNPKLLEHFKITVWKTRFKIEGSLTKYIAGTNCYTSAFYEIKEALIEIGEILKVDIAKGIIRRIDLAHNFKLDNPVSLYLLDIWSCPHTLIEIYSDNSVLLRNSILALSFYDKLLQMIKKKRLHFEGTIDEDAYILRYELQLRSRIRRKFNNELIYVEKLFDKRFYSSLIDMWFKYFKKVKTVCFTSNLTHNYFDAQYLTPKTFFENLALFGFHKLTTKEKRIIFSSAKNNRDHNFSSRVVNKINHLSNNEIINVNGKTLWSELEKKVQQFYKEQQLKLSCY